MYTLKKYTLHGDTYYVAKGRSNLSLKREGDNSEAVDTIQIEWYE